MTTLMPFSRMNWASASSLLRDAQLGQFEAEEEVALQGLHVDPLGPADAARRCPG